MILQVTIESKTHVFDSEKSHTCSCGWKIKDLPDSSLGKIGWSEHIAIILETRIKEIYAR